MKKRLLVLIVSIFVVNVLCGCINENKKTSAIDIKTKFVGKWIFGSESITFYSNGTYVSTNGNGTFELKDNRLLLQDEVNLESYEFTYSFSNNNNTLTLTNLADGSLIVLIREGAYNTYENAEYGFRISYPAPWSEREGVLPNAVVTFLKDTGPMGVLGGSVSVTVSNAGGYDMDDFKAAHIENISLLYTDFNFTYQGNATLAGEPGYELIYTYSQGVYSIIQREIWTIKNDILYFLVCIVEKQNYNEFEDEFDQMISSFEIIS